MVLCFSTLIRTHRGKPHLVVTSASNRPHPIDPSVRRARRKGGWERLIEDL